MNDRKRKFVDYSYRLFAFASPIVSTSNSAQILKNPKLKENINELKSVKEITELCKDRWINPRSKRDKSYNDYIKDNFFKVFGNLYSQLNLGFKNGHKDNTAKANKQF